MPESLFKSLRVGKVIPLALLLVAFAGHIIILRAALQDGGSPLFYDSDVIKDKGCDFYALYVAGDNLRKGRSVYEYESHSAKTPCHFSFRYLPTAALIGAPLSILPPKAAYVAWVAGLEFCLLTCLMLVWFLAGRKMSAFVPLAALWLLYTPMYLEFRMGQFNLAQAFFVLMAAASLRLLSGRGFATWMAASFIWKHNTIIAAPSLIRRKKHSPLIVAAVLIAVLGGWHFVKFPGSLQAFSENFSLQGTGATHGFTRGNLGLCMFVKVLAQKHFAPYFIYAIYGFVFALGLAATQRKKSPDLAVQLCLWLALAVLAYKHTWEHHYVMALPLLTLIGLSGRGIFFWIAAALLALPTPYYFFRGDWMFNEMLIYHAWKPAGLMIAIALAVFGSNKKLLKQKAVK